ncbi:MAG: peptidoglycan DD-metalloendopeptidase family protein [Patescibacteria group bacterium]
MANIDQDSIKNSQSMDLLEANVSSNLVIFDKKNNNNKDEVDLNKDVKIVANSALSPSSSPIGGSDVIDNGEPISDQVSVYKVRKGDSISQIADMFDVSVNTILWANDLKKGEKLVEGDMLFILPVSGVSHTILKGQTLKTIAKKYNVDVSDIARLNGIAEDAKLMAGDELIVPNAEMLNIESEKPKISPKDVIKAPLKILLGYFTNPVPEYKRKSQGLHGNNGVDLAAPTGTPIVASASGVVLLARKGYNGGYGNMVIIRHPNGTQTLYGHMSKLVTRTGEVVNQGETIGYVGSTGRSTGPHLHFEVQGARNPAIDL